MLPDANVAAPDWDNLVGRNQGAAIVGVHPPNFYQVVLRYRIGNQLIAGRMVYYKPDCEAAAVKIAAMRAARDGIPQQGVTP
jgi:hypothetical protein